MRKYLLFYAVQSQTIGNTLHSNTPTPSNTYAFNSDTTAQKIQDISYITKNYNTGIIITLVVIFGVQCIVFLVGKQNH